MSVCYRYAKDEDEAASFLNNGFLKILTNLDKYKIDVPFEAWIRRIMINSIIDTYRRNKKHRENLTHMEFQDFQSFDGLVAYNDADKQLDADRILDMIKQLPNISQQVFNLSVIDGYNHREISEKLGIAEGTSKWHLSNARKMLREKVLKTMENINKHCHNE
jgi:RNA polymerase sigma-70 factor (ECF subfamily)